MIDSRLTLHSGRRAGLARVAFLVLAAAWTAAGCAASGAFSDGSGFGLKAGRSLAPSSPEDLRSSNWDVNVQLRPDATKVAESTDSWSASSLSSTTVGAGQFLFMVMRNPDVDGASARTVAGVLRQDEVARGVDTSEITDAEFMGLPGAMYVSFPGDRTYNVTLLAISQKCVYILNVTRSGEQQQVADWFGQLVRVFKTYSGGPANAPACR
jgi:hypothetical protein